MWKNQTNSRSFEQNLSRTRVDDSDDGAVTQPPVNTLVALYSYLYSCRHQPTTTRQIPTVDEGERS